MKRLRQRPRPNNTSRDLAERLERARATIRTLGRTAARLSEGSYRPLLARLAVPLSIERADRFVLVNSAMLGALGYDREADLLARPVHETFVADDVPLFVDAVQTALGAPEPVTVQVRRLQRDGRVRIMEGQLVAIPFGVEQAVLASWRDVTERKQVTSKMMQVDRMIAVGTLAGGVAHEINNPLAYVSANIAYAIEELGKLRVTCVAQERDGRAETVNQVDAITEALVDASDGAHRVTEIVRDLKMFSRAEENRVEPIDVHRVLELSINMTYNELRHRARIVRDFVELPPVDASDGRLTQIFLNLLVNAAQAIPEGNADRNEVRVVTRVVGRQVLIEVRDTGMGIAPEHQRQVFDPFFTTKPVGVGTGLGLAICQSIVSGIGGEIQVESDVGKGSTFRILLPISESTLRPQVPDTVPPSVGIRRARILVIDDEPMVLKSVLRILSPTHEVVAQTRPTEALERLLAGEVFDLVLCDLMMPEMSGMELYERLHPAFPKTAEAIVFFTGGAFTPRAQEFLERVGNKRIDKPFEVDTLRSLVQQLTKSRATRTSQA
jgi:PAS domain S-box-containing protein